MSKKESSVEVGTGGTVEVDEQTEIDLLDRITSLAIDKLDDVDAVNRACDMIETNPDYQEYHSGRWITFASLESLKKSIFQQLEDRTEIADSIKETAKDFIADLLRDIIRDCHHYSQVVIRSEHVSRQAQQRFLDRDKFTDKIEVIDRDRRFTHNAILTNLGLLYKVVYGPMPERAPFRSLRSLGIVVPPGSLFDLEQVQDSNRQYIGRWAFICAIGNDLTKNLEQLRRKRKELLDKKQQKRKA